MSNDFTTKLCSQCGQYHPCNKTYFFTDNRSSDGFRNPCKICKGVTPRTKETFNVMLDDADRDLDDGRLYKASNGHGGVYIRFSQQTYLHRVIMERVLGRELTKGEVVDHVNGDTLDNRRSNLRLATYSDNSANSKRHCDNRAGYKGVSFNKLKQKWVATIMVHGKQYSLGYFTSPEDAHNAYVNASLELRGEYARPE